MPSSGEPETKPPIIQHPHATTLAQLRAQLETDATQGLTESEAHQRLETYGRNELPRIRGSFWRVYLAPIFNGLILIYLVAIVLMVLLVILFQAAGAVDVTGADWTYTGPNMDEQQNAGVSDAGAFVLAETALSLHCWGQNPVVTAKLQLNGQDRFSEREGSYFDLVQPFQHHTRTPDTGINVYSFGLRPEEHQPSGTCNFSRIDNATLQLVVSSATVERDNTAKVRVYATNYNVLRVMSGMGGLNFAN